MNATERWTWRQVESNVDKYGGRQIAGAHNKLVDICAGLQAELAAVYALLPGYHYMDPPDGGDVTPLEQMRRMAEDAANYRNGL